MNLFKALLNDINWDDNSIMASFRTKLPSQILNWITTGYFPNLPKLYNEYKTAALQAESNIALANMQRQD